MALDNFRRIDMQINRANDYQIETQFVKEGDYNGRELVVQITDAGEVSNQSGVSLNLGWQHNSAGNSGLDPFAVVDASKGIFKITYPTEMLIAGDVTASIQVLESGRITLTRNFKITVENNPIDEDAIVSENSFTALQEALVKVNDLEDNYAPRLNEVNTQLAQTDENLDERGINVKRPPVPMIGAKGDGVTDDTTAIQNILDLGKAIFFPSGIFLVDAITGLKPNSNQDIKLDREAVIQAKANGNGMYSIFKINNVENLTLSGGSVKGDRTTHIGTTGEWGMGIDIGANASNITVSDMIISDCWGDGVYVGSQSGSTENIQLFNIVCDNNRRNGLSVVNVENMIIRDSVFSNTTGVDPQAGIDVEPNIGQSVKNLTLDNCQLYNNTGVGLDFMGITGIIENIKCNNITSNFNSTGLRLIECGNIGFSFCDFNENDVLGITIPRDVRDVSFYKTQSSKNGAHGLDIVTNNQTDGVYNINFTDCNFDDNSKSNSNQYDGVRIDSLDESGVIDNIGFTGCSFSNKEEPKTQRYGLSWSTTSSIITDVFLGIQSKIDNNVTATTSGREGVVVFYNNNRIQPILADTTAKRPHTARYGTAYFDTTLGKPIFRRGSVWVDANGTVV